MPFRQIFLSPDASNDVISYQNLVRTPPCNRLWPYLRDTGSEVLSGAIPEKIAYRRASDESLALTEMRFPTLNDRADKLAQRIIDSVGAK